MQRSFNNNNYNRNYKNNNANQDNREGRNKNNKNRRVRRNKIRRFRGVRRRAIIVNSRRNKIRRRIRNDINRNDKISQDEENINYKIDNLTESIKKMNLNMNNKATNLIRRRKERRYDVITSAMTMALNNKIIPIYSTPNRVINVPIYSINTVSTINNHDLFIVWYPYGINFSVEGWIKELQKIHIEVAEQEHHVDTLSNLVSINASGMSPLITGRCGVWGMHRLIAATMKIKCNSAPLQRAGQFTVYKTNDNTGFPLLFLSQEDTTPNSTICHTYYTTMWEYILGMDFSQINIKNNYAATEISYVNEYNVYEGNNIFSGPDEYLGEEFQTSTEGNAAYGGNRGNTQGNNIKYIIKFDRTPGVNVTYTIETWQVFQVVPDPSTGLLPMASVCGKTFDRSVIEQMKVINPLSSQ